MQIVPQFNEFSGQSLDRLTTYLQFGRFYSPRTNRVVVWEGLFGLGRHLRSYGVHGDECI